MRRRFGPGAIALTAILPAALLAGAVTAGRAAAQQARGGAAESTGQRVYRESCVRCHGPDGRGIPGVYPALAGDPFVTAAEEPAIQVVLVGRAPAPDVPQMPRYRDLLSDAEVAAVVSYIRSSWGNDAGPVSAGTVASVRERVAAEPEDGGEVDRAGGWRERGERLFADYCAACHERRGRGVEDIFPALAGNAVVTSAPEPLIYTVLHGRGGMPAFAGALGAEELADVLSYIRTSWGNDASLVAPETVSGVPEPEEEY